MKEEHKMCGASLQSLHCASFILFCLLIETAKQNEQEIHKPLRNKQRNCHLYSHLYGQYSQSESGCSHCVLCLIHNSTFQLCRVVCPLHGVAVTVNYNVPYN